MRQIQKYSNGLCLINERIDLMEIRNCKDLNSGTTLDLPHDFTRSMRDSITEIKRLTVRLISW